MDEKELEVGDVIQLRPDYPGGFGGMLVVVTEPKSWGCQGYLMAFHDFDAVRFQGKAFVRPRFENFEFVGKIQWMPEDCYDE